MHHPIDPKIDCVFKALLGAEDNRALLIHFLNALLGAELPAPISAVEILNPYNEREFLDDKLSIVDVKARDERGRLYQIEIQILVHADLPARMLYAWADLMIPPLIGQRTNQPFIRLLLARGAGSNYCFLTWLPIATRCLVKRPGQIAQIHG